MDQALKGRDWSADRRPNSLALSALGCFVDSQPRPTLATQASRAWLWCVGPSGLWECGRQRARLLRVAL